MTRVKQLRWREGSTADRLTFVLMAPVSASLGAWQAELQTAGFDLILDPTRPQYDDPRSVPVVVRGRDSVIEFEIVPASPWMAWFPIGMLQIRNPSKVALFEWPESDVFAAADSADAIIEAGMVFEAKGIHGELPALVDQRARILFENLPEVRSQRHADLLTTRYDS